MLATAVGTGEMVDERRAGDVAAAAALYDAGRADNTRRAYLSDWRGFTRWTESRGVSALPASAETVAMYVAWAVGDGGLRVSTVRRHLSTIATAHRDAGLETPTSSAVVRRVWAGAARTRGVAAEGARPLSVAELARLTEACPPTLAGLRDRALLLVGYAAALRRSELVALDVADITYVPGSGLRVAIRRGKTDGAGAGRSVGVPIGRTVATDPVAAYLAYVAVAGIADGAVFRSVDRHGNLKGRLPGETVTAVLQRAAVAAGVDTARLSGHSLRAGLATSAAAAGVDERAIAATTGHRSLEVLRRYIRHGSVFVDNAAAAIL